MASKPVEAQTCNPQSCVECRLDGYHWFSKAFGYTNKNRTCCACSIKWGTFLLIQQNNCGSGYCAPSCYSGIFTRDGYVYTRDEGMGSPENNKYRICRRSA